MNRYLKILMLGCDCLKCHGDPFDALPGPPIIGLEVRSKITKILGSLVRTSRPLSGPD